MFLILFSIVNTYLINILAFCFNYFNPSIKRIMLKKFALIFFLPALIFSQTKDVYPKDYFVHPLDITLVLSGTFAELRSNHFHSGLDIKTQQREGLKIYASASGYVSRIKVQHFGYGKALYITHPNGYTTVYAHLQKFSPKIEAYIKSKQYENETFEIERFPNNDELIVEQGEVIAYSGNTGGSGGPHLHFEIRDNMERPINPLLFGMDVKDTTKPVIKSLMVYPISDDAHANKSNEVQKLRLRALGNGDYTTEKIQAHGKIGFAIETNDRQDLAYNNNGVYNIQTFFNGNKKIDIGFKRFSFDETKHINCLIDYGYYKTHKDRLQKLFIEKNNPLSLYTEVDDNGYLFIEDSTASVYKIRVKDFHDNDSWLTINIEGKKETDVKRTPKKETFYYIQADKDNELLHKNITVHFNKDTFYDNFYMDFSVSNDTVSLHKDIIPTKKYFTITYDTSAFKKEDLKHLYIARLVGYNDYPLYSKTHKTENSIYTTTKTLGKYALVTDKTPPTIAPINFSDGKWLSKYRYLKLKIDDKGSGISNYRATVNGKWILMEYDYKTDTLVHDFKDGNITETKNNLKVIVTDNVGNSSTFEATFYRK